jgi:CopG family nickel-responsive transcriptional regulator
MEPALYERLDALLAGSAARNRSEFIRDLIRDQIVAREWDDDAEVLGTITYVYDHEARDLSRKLTRLQHHDHDHILVTTHLHLDHHLCAEVVVARGTAREVRALADRIGRQKGVLHVALATSSTGAQLGRVDHARESHGTRGHGRSRRDRHGRSGRES